MNQPEIIQQPGGFTRREGLIALLGSAAALAGCGGGGTSGVASVTSGGTGSFSSGAITGFGSVIVNGVRYDDSKARITDDDGSLRSSGDLKLGMVVSISGSAVITGVNGSVASANSIGYGSELKGPIESKGGQTLVVLGQTVQITASTVFEAGITGGLSGLNVGQLVEVHGFIDPVGNQLVATRIEHEDNASECKLQGQVKTLNTGAKTFSIGTLTISYASVPSAELPAGLAEGLLVRVRLQATPATGIRIATRVRAVEHHLEDRDQAEVEGTITAFTSASQFSVNGLPVNATGARFPDGTQGLVLGAAVEVEGRLSGGVLVATEVEIKSASEVDHKEFEFHGTISGLNTSARTFVVRGTTIDYSGPVRYDGGSESSLASGRSVEVKGIYDAATASVKATRIEFES